MFWIIGLAICKQIVMFKHNKNHDKNIYSMAQSEIFNKLNVDDQIHFYLLNGFVGDLTAESLEKLRNNENVAFIEEDKEINVKYKTKETNHKERTLIKRMTAQDDPKTTLTSQVSAPWGISRISSGTNINKKGIFRYPISSAEDVTVYVLDTGIDLSHKEFEGRAVFGANFTPSENELDENGHGTHCAGVIGGKSVGIAKKSKLVSVKVLEKNGNGMLSSLIMGIDFVIRQHSDKKEELNRLNSWLGDSIDEFSTAKQNILSDMINFSLPHRFENMRTQSLMTVKRPISLFKKKKCSDSKTPLIFEKERKKNLKEKPLYEDDFPKRKRVELVFDKFMKSKLPLTLKKDEVIPKTIVNMSVGGLKSRVLDYALKYATDIGIHFSVAAGNDHENACKFSPSSSNMVLTAGASTKKDTVAFFSNYGKCVDLYAPGVEIESAWIKNQYKLVSGTSMAAPHVTGAMALYLGEKNYTPAELQNLIKEDSYRVIREKQQSKEEYNLVSIRKLLREIHEIEKERNS
ncbi:Subtilisin-related protease/Vacuolar protease B [Pseudoloma neurophilia]|uniref:Subtilisin-related protease/Vacuolar protease B n=1 Tax=Pseudoloma neurophilia TaxID=146866 RepID=A0A0R0LTX7_9MICR|nr:Subtilisin-related protease/Vacuolar protease B [Pseudoloma neurophilia]